MKRKYVQAMLAGMTAVVSLTASAGSVYASAVNKEQTVYVNADESGNTQDIIVSNWLKNSQGDHSLLDKSDLSDIENVKGEETFTQSGDGTITWEAGGKDIYYQGKTSDELPVSVRMTYYLNGNKIQPSQLAGKSGEVKIRIDYENHSQQTRVVNGKQESISTPFMMTTGMILPVETFSNVQVSNGKVISDGKNNIVIGIGFPGLSDSLKISDIKGMEDKEIPDYVEVTASVTDFSLAMTATVATTGTLSQLGLDGIDDLDDLKESMDTLSDSSKTLVKGSKALQEGIQQLDASADVFTAGLASADSGAGQLKSGIDTLNAKKGELTSGINQLANGINSLETGADTLQAGVKDYTDAAAEIGTGIGQVNSGAVQLKGGIDTLNSKKKELTDGVSVLGAGGKQLNSGAKSLENGIGAYTAGASSINEGLQQLNGALQSQMGQVEQLPQAVGSLQAGCAQLSQGPGSFRMGHSR